MQPSRQVNALLWTVQVLLASLFLFAGGMKLAAPAVVGCLAASVAYGRWQQAPRRASSRRSVLQAAH
jgi:hypothetical protein